MHININTCWLPKNIKGENGRPLLLIPKLLLMKTNFYLVNILLSNVMPKTKNYCVCIKILTLVGDQ